VSAERDLMATDRELSLFEHLNELRIRMTWAAGALMLGTIISMIFAKQALQVLILPLGQRIPQTIAPTEHFVVYFRIASCTSWCALCYRASCHTSASTSTICCPAPP